MTMLNNEDLKSGNVIRVGNFELSVDGSSPVAELCVRSVSGSWGISWNETTYMYSVMTGMMRDSGCHKYIEALLSLFYNATSYPHDLAAICETQSTPFMDGFVRLIEEQVSFELRLKGDGTDEENEAALRSVVDMQDIQDELERLEEVRNG